jgi:hypothetical protein
VRVGFAPRLAILRVGQLLVDGGVREGVQIIPSAWIDDITLNGSQDAWLAGGFTPLFPGGRCTTGTNGTSMSTTHR